MPLCDSSETYVRAVWLSPSPADLLPGLTAGISEVSRFSCMKFIGVSGVFDYAGPNRDSRYRLCSCCPSPIFKTVASGMIFSELDTTPPILCLRFAAYLTIGLAQDSRPSGSLVLTRKALSSSTPCRFIPAHINRHSAPRRSVPKRDQQMIDAGGPLHRSRRKKFCSGHRRAWE